jgi:hypothetical protein
MWRNLHSDSKTGQNRGKFPFFLTASLGLQPQAIRIEAAVTKGFAEIPTNAHN